MDDFQRELLARLPLAQAVFHLFSHVLARPFLQELFERHRGRCYERELSFAQMVYLIRDALLVHEGSAQQSFDRAAEAGELPVSIGNAYGKLSRLPVPLSIGLLAEGAARLGELMPRQGCGSAGSPLPASLADLAVVAIDGKKLKRAAKRLKALRGLPGKLLSAKLLVALDLRTKLALAMSVSEDGEANDVPLVPALLPQVRQRTAGQSVLWVADAQFCDLNLPALLTGERGHFLLRFTKKMHFHADAGRAAQQGADARGRRFVQEWGWIGGAKDKRRRYVRRITLFRENERENEQDVSLITDLLDEKPYPPADLLEVYLMRWGIEQVFQQVTEVFELKKLIGSTPRAGVFQAAFCLLLYDMVQVARAHAADVAGRAVDQVSAEKLFYDMRQQLIAWAAAGDAAHAAAYLATPAPPPQLRRSLRRWIGGSWTPRWIKTRNKAARPPTKRAKQSGAHTSVWRALRADRTATQEPVRS
jgi:hypothetical protein